MSNYSRNDICAVIVTYFPDSEFGYRLKRISCQVNFVIIIDNNSACQNFFNLQKTVKQSENIELISNNSNLGIAAALNKGVKKALSYGYSWIVTFDQDSLPEQDFIFNLREAWKQYHQPEKLMIAGCNANFINSTIGKKKNKDKPWEEVSHVITSGSLISGKAFERVGYFNEDLFIDYVDIEYCIRLRGAGCHIIMADYAILNHNMGNLVEHNLFGRIIHPTHHAPIRRYYQFRNSILIYKLYKKKDPEWCKANRIIMLKILCLILLFEKQRLRKSFYILKGIWHGFRNRAGEKGEIVFQGISGGIK